MPPTAEQIEKLRNAKPVSRETALKAVNWDNYGRWLEKQKSIASAQTRPLPGPAERAFTNGDIKAGDCLVKRVVPIHFAALQAVKSPILKMIESATTGVESKMDWSEEDQWNACYIFTVEPRQLRGEMKLDGIDSIKGKAAALVENWSAAQVNVVILAILEQIKRHVETTVRFAAEMEGEGNLTFFRDKNPSLETPKG